MGEMSILNKICVCIFCSQAACFAGCVYDSWGSIQACFQSELNCMGCCWTIFYPVCADCKLGDTDAGIKKCTLGIKYCLLGCGLDFVAPCDGCINCILYTKNIFTDGVSGWSSVTKDASYIGKMIRGALSDVDQKSEEPDKTFGTYSP